MKKDNTIVSKRLIEGVKKRIYEKKFESQPQSPKNEHEQRAKKD